MYKLILILLTLMMSSHVSADWLQIGVNGNLTTFVDPSTISKSENSVGMWQLVDLKESKKEETGKSFLSAKGVQEYDCKTEQVKKISLSFYSENMGKGEVVHAYADPEKWTWTPITKGSMAELMWKTACGK
jgi:hypothetical protein